jgi:serine protease
MHRYDPRPRRGLRGLAVAVAALALGLAGVRPAAAAGGGSAQRPGGGAVWVTNHGHRILVHPHGRFGVVPQRHPGRLAPRVPAAGSGPLMFGGGIDGIGVTTGSPQVFLVFWGSQWGSASTDGNGNTVLSGDPNGAAPYYQTFLQSLGTNGETWSGVMTQYCDGGARGDTMCAPGQPHVGYPTGGALAGVFVDNAQPAPQQASHADLAAEAVNAAQFFGHTSAAQNRNAQYVVLSPSGTNPDGFPNAGFCAYHDFTTSQFGDIAFTNMPYVTDAGASCGQNFVNGGSAGTLDGFSIVGGHEYAETITDQNPAGGWTAADGEENGDLCAWVTSGPGATQDITIGANTFAVQGTWSNDTNECEVSHSIVTG